MRTVCLMTIMFVASSAFAQSKVEPWSTYRGNAQRTGNTDGIAGPAEPKLLWVYKSQEHYIAAPVAAGERVLFSGLGPFNRPSLAALPITPKAVVEPTWVKSAPYLKLPIVSSPALAGKAILFGDGMHQTDGAVLHCLPADGGYPLWQLQVPGELVHLEGAPSVLGSRAYIGGGSAGLMCVEWDKATIDGKAYDLDTIAKMQVARFKELEAKYLVDKVKDPDFAMPPSEDQLHKAAPKLLFQQGKGRWHVDAPVNIAGDKLLVCSAFLDKEKVGDRAVHCLNAATGESVWRAELKINPWGGATVVDDLVLVSTSTINYDTKLLKGAKGEVTALGLADGKEKWKKEFPGGVLGCVAVSNGLAVFACTDGKVRALSLKDGERRMLYDAKSPMFAPVAVVGEVVYASDLKGVVHAIDLKTGAAKWTFDIAAEPVKAPGMIYGGVTVHGGKLFVATANLEGTAAKRDNVIVCIGAK